MPPARNWLSIGATASIHAARFATATAAGDWDRTIALATGDLSAGADVLDVCYAGHPSERRLLPTALRRLRAAGVVAPLWADSRDGAALAAAATALAPGDALNSVHLADAATLRSVAAVAGERGLDVVGLAVDDGGVPRTAAGRLAVADRLLSVLTTECGLAVERIWLDLVALPLATPTGAADRAAALDAVALARRRWPGVRTVLGVSNVGWGTPAARRARVEADFLADALERGLDAAFALPASPA